PAGTLPWSRHVEGGLVSLAGAHSLPVHPTQLYAAVDGLIILALLTAFFPRRRRDGEVMALLMVTYPVTRFLIEGLRDDEPAVLAGLTMSQWISVMIFVGGLAVWRYLLSLPRGRYADAWGPRPGAASGEVGRGPGRGALSPRRAGTRRAPFPAGPRG
ncbi:MAG: prolipoprotein diacylglyceryl transferase, partial [Planctomycetia bacterium]|nr:prolipoprotein diacylglyceryl transferase [Planctomycetia bacterium]